MKIFKNIIYNDLKFVPFWYFVLESWSRILLLNKNLLDFVLKTKLPTWEKTFFLIVCLLICLLVSILLFFFGGFYYKFYSSAKNSNEKPVMQFANPLLIKRLQFFENLRKQ